jgi:DNA invertase Pin-like site-specific DNA recombinase
MAATPTAYSYLRFSSPQQAEGDSLRRQQELRDRWLARSGAALDTSLSLKDEGVSAFSGDHRTNPDRHALAAFLELVRRGRIPRGSYLVVESLDRLSREHIRPALTLLLNLIDAGIRIVQLLPVETVYDEKVEPMSLVVAIMELSRGHSESRMKSERVGGAWKEKRKKAAAEGVTMTKRLPGWLRTGGERIIIDEKKAAVVRRIFKMATEGHGIGAITKKLNAEGVPNISPPTKRSATGQTWPRSYVAKLLGNRATVGEYQPHTRRGGIKRRPDGKPIAGYFPAILTDDQYHAAQAALKGRKLAGGRPPTLRLNLFTGLLRDARDGGRMHVANRGPKSGVLILPSGATNGVKGSKLVSFPMPVFERAVLSRLREIDPREILPEGNPAADKVLALTGKLADVEGRIEAIKSRMVEGDEAGPIMDVLRTLDVKRAKAADELAVARREAACPLSEAWGEARNLAEAIDAAPDQTEARVRLRGALRRIVEGIWCLFVARGSNRLAAVQVWFAGGAHRDFLIALEPARGNASAKRAPLPVVYNFADTSAPILDLRKRAGAAKAERALNELDVDALFERNGRPKRKGAK